MKYIFMNLFFFWSARLWWSCRLQDGGRPNAALRSPVLRLKNVRAARVAGRQHRTAEVHQLDREQDRATTNPSTIFSIPIKIYDNFLTLYRYPRDYQPRAMYTVGLIGYIRDGQSSFSNHLTILNPSCVQFSFEWT